MIDSNNRYVRRQIGKQFDNQCSVGTFNFKGNNIKFEDMFRNLELDQSIKSIII